MTQNLTARGRQRGGEKNTPFGTKMRDIRRSKGLLLFDVARVAGVTSGFLSLVETGSKAIPETLIAKIVIGLGLNSWEEHELRNAAALSAKEYRIRMKEGADLIDREIAYRLQAGFASMSPKKKHMILELLEGD